MFYYLAIHAAFISDTVILKDDEKLIRYLFAFLNNKNAPLKLCYRASLHGWSSQHFHEKCDGKADTVVLVKVGNCIFGGYTDQTLTWDSKNFTKFILVNFRTILRDVKTKIRINLTLQRTTKDLLSRAGFELTSSGF